MKHIKYTRYQNLYTKLKHTAKKKQYFQIVDNLKLYRKIWKTVNRITGRTNEEKRQVYLKLL